MRHGYAHHNQRLLVIGDFAVLAEFDRWSADEVAAIMDSAAAFLATLTRDAR